MQIRRATADDAAVLSDLASRTFTETFGHLYPPQDLQDFIDASYTVERQRTILAHPDYAVWLLELDGEAVGHAAAGPCGLPHPDVKPGDGELKRLYLIKTQQSCGWGSRLLETALAFGAKPFAISELPEIDWVAKVRRELSPVEAGRFFVFGSHDADKVPAGRIALQIEATVAFGTGHHGTTLGCLRAFDRLVDQGIRPAKVVDIGAGTAVLALAAARVFPDAVVIASDIDEVAVDVAEANVAVNGLTGRIVCLEAAGFAHPQIKAAAPFDLIFANILKGPLIELAPDMARHVAPGGLVILSGLLVVQAESIIAAYVANGFTPEAREDLGEWSALVLRRN